MNEAHRQFLASSDWAEMLRTDLLPWLERATDLGDDVLEIGPGPGLTTDLLRQRAAQVTAVEIDPELATRLRGRLTGTNVEVIQDDGTRTGLAAERFATVTCFGVLHHMPKARDQDRLFAEAFRLLRPQGSFIGTDSRDLDGIRSFHENDVFVPIDPDTFADRLRAAGFPTVDLDVGEFEIRFHAVKPD